MIPSFSWPLIFSLLALFCGPLLMRLSQRFKFLPNALDSFVLTSIGALVLLHILPHTFSDIGWLALPIALTSLFLPTLAERLQSRFANTAHEFSRIVAILGMALHALSDGIALSEGSPTHGFDGSILPLAVILHRIPDGLAIWWMTAPRYGKAAALRSVILMGVATLVGYELGSSALDSLTPQSLGIFEAIVAGSLLHIILHKKIPHVGHSHATLKLQWSALAGVVLGCILTGFIFYFSSSHAHSGHHSESIQSIFLTLALASSPALLFSYAAAGFIQSFVPQAGTRWLGSGNKLLQALKGTVFGLPLAVCSCGVIPLYRSLVLRGVPMAASMAFLIATPELGLDALILTYPLMGGTFTILRLAAATFLALAIALIMGILFQNNILSTQYKKEELTVSSTHGGRFKKALHQGFVESFDDTAPWIITGLALAALVTPFFTNTSVFLTVPAWIQVIFFTLLGMPLYVCASGATPLAAVFLASGISPGAVVAFLLTGPATNATTFGVLKNLHNRRFAVGYSLVMATTAILMGIVINLFFPAHPQTSAAKNFSHMHEVVGPIHYASFAILILLLFYSILRQGPRALIETVIRFDADPNEIHVHETSEASCCGDVKPVVVPEKPSCCGH